MKIRKKKFACYLLSLAAIAAIPNTHAALVDRGNGLVYDDVLDVTWISDIRLAWTLGYDPLNNDFSAGTNNGDDFLSHEQALAFVDSLNTNSFDGGSTTGYLGFTGWRLPQLHLTDAELVNSSFSGVNAEGVQNRGRNITDTRQELSHLYNVSLGGAASASAPNDCQSNTNGGCIWSTADLGLFINTSVLDTSDSGMIANGFSGTEGSGTRDALTTFFYEQRSLLADGTPETNRVYSFVGRQGYQNDTALNFGSLDGGGRAWMVHDGDIGAAAVVPLPAAAWFFGSAIIGLSVYGRR